MDGTQIVSITTECDGKIIKRTASAFVDASYEGDLMVASGVSYTFGRESKDQYNEPSAGVKDSGDG